MYESVWNIVVSKSSDGVLEVLQKLRTSVVFTVQSDSCLILLIESYFCGIIGDSG